jgi:hypothetical protein
VVEKRILDAVQLVPQAITCATESRGIGMDDADGSAEMLVRLGPLGGLGDGRLIVPSINVEASARRKAYIDQRTVFHLLAPMRLAK